MQTGGLLKDLTVARDRRADAVAVRRPAPVAEALARAGIADIGKRRVGKCSGGQQQRVRFAHGAGGRPGPDRARRADHRHGRRGPARLLVGDPRGRRQGRTVLFATHYLEEADAYADRIVLCAAAGSSPTAPRREIKALASGRTVRATLPGADPGALAALPGVDAVEVRGDTVLRPRLATPTRSPAHLLTSTAARDIEITARNLEDAFLALTADETRGAT